MHPRALTSRERETLLCLLPEGGFDGVEQYRQQVEHATVIGRCPCGCPTITLEIDRSLAPRSTVGGTPLLPLEGWAGEGDQLVELILFAPEGWLQSLELVYYTEKPPSDLPDPGAWRVAPRDSERA